MVCSVHMSLYLSCTPELSLEKWNFEIQNINLVIMSNNSQSDFTYDRAKPGSGIQANSNGLETVLSPCFVFKTGLKLAM